jgi:hypothetical protein
MYPRAFNIARWSGKCVSGYGPYVTTFYLHRGDGVPFFVRAGHDAPNRITK